MNASPRATRLLVFVLMAAAVLGGPAGCKRGKAPPHRARGDSAGPAVPGISADELFKLGLADLEHLEHYQTGEMLQQVVDRFNQWAKAQEPLPGWKPDPLLDGLPQAYKDLPAVRELDKLAFPREDAHALLAALWIRDLSKWACGQSLDEVEQAGRLFDWTVRNIQLQAAASGPDGRPLARPRQFPWETLLFGQGTPLDRAWVFILLARQQAIDAAVIALAPPEGADQALATPWTVGVLSSGQLYLFDPALGLPLPGPDGVKLGPDGQLEIRPATLAQLADNPALLRRLDLDEARPYPVTPADLGRAVAQVAASPTELSMRMRMLEDRLAGADRMSISADASGQAGRLKSAGGVQGVVLWTRPFSVLEQRLELASGEEFNRQWALEMLPFIAGEIQPDPRSASPRPGEGALLWRGRVSHLRGNLGGDRGATYFYQAARPPESRINTAVAEGRLPPGLRPVILRAKADATYWLGLVSFELGNPRAAADYFQKRTLEAAPGGPWTHGAAYNLGRTFEASGQYDQAIAQYEADAGSPGHHGNLLRARWLRELSVKPSPPGRPHAE